MRKLLILFLTCLLLAGCRGNRYYLDKVESLWGADYDSVQYYLLKVFPNIFLQVVLVLYQVLAEVVVLVYLVFEVLV